MTDGVYVAAPLGQKLRAAWVVGMLLSAGLRVVSTWHRRAAGVSRDPEGPDERARVLSQNRRELRMAGLFVALTEEKEGRSTYAEIGEALGLGIPVVWSSERGGACLYDADPLVTLVGDDDAIGAAVLAALCREQGSEEPSSGVRLRASEALKEVG